MGGLGPGDKPGKVCFYDSSDHWGVTGMEAPFHKVGQINISLTLASPARLFVNAAQGSAPIANRGIRFYDVETVTEYYELTESMEADLEQKK
jgi:hypothetical protein